MSHAEIERQNDAHNRVVRNEYFMAITVVPISHLESFEIPLSHYCEKPFSKEENIKDAADRIDSILYMLKNLTFLTIIFDLGHAVRNLDDIYRVFSRYLGENSKVHTIRFKDDSIFDSVDLNAVIPPESSCFSLIYMRPYAGRFDMLKRFINTHKKVGIIHLDFSPNHSSIKQSFRAITARDVGESEELVAFTAGDTNFFDCITEPRRRKRMRECAVIIRRKIRVPDLADLIGEYTWSAPSFN